jgi:hypothetical protein
MKLNVAPMIFSISRKLGTHLYGANNSPEVKEQRDLLFFAMQSLNSDEFSRRINNLKSLSADISQLRSVQRTTILQELAKVEKEYVNQDIDWPDVLSYGEDAYYRRIELEEQKAQFIRVATAAVAELELTVVDYILAATSADTTFVLLAGSRSIAMADTINSLIGSASPDQLIELKRLALPALYAAVHEGSPKTAEIIIRRLDPDPNVRLANGDTLLHLACEKRDFALVKVLLECRANPMLQNSAGKIPGEGIGFWHDDATKIPELLEQYRNLRQAQQQMLALFESQLRSLQLARLAVPKEINMRIAENLTGALIRVLPKPLLRRGEGRTLRYSAEQRLNYAPDHKADSMSAKPGMP